MKVKMNYGTGVLCLPEAVLSRLGEVDGNTLKVLLRLAGTDHPSREKIAAELAMSAEEVAAAIGYWRGAGILVDEKKAAEPATVGESIPDSKPQNVKVEDSAKSIPSKASPASVPRYSTEELTAALESRAGLTALLDEAARVFGKVFSTHEISVLIGIVDYLGIDGEYLLLLLAHCVKLDKKSLRYVEKVALELYDEGITDSATLQEYLKRKEHRLEAEGKIRTLFGMNSRALTAKEKKLIDTWLFTYKFGMDVITRAYEITVDATGKPSIPYAGSIMDRWAAADLHTLADIESADAARAAQGKTPAKPGNSFDTDDFFGAALQRSFGEDFSPNKK